jgi:hypothetical protein
MKPAWQRLMAAVVLAVLGAGGASAEGGHPPPVCLSCPKPHQYCWIFLYRWEDYNSRAGFGTGMLITESDHIGEKDKLRAEVDTNAALPKEIRAKVRSVNPIPCPEVATLKSRQP